MAKANDQLIGEAIHGPNGALTWNAETQRFTHTGNSTMPSKGDIPWMEDMKKALSSILTQSKIDTILAQLTTALLSVGISQTDIDNILSVVRSYIAGIESPTIANISYAINLTLATSSLGFTEAEVVSIVNESMSGFADFATHSEVNKIQSNLDTHIASDEGRWQSTLDFSVAMEARLKQYVEDRIAGVIFPVDYGNPTLVMGNGGLVNLLDGQEWTAPTNGAIICATGGLLSVAYQVQINNTGVWDSPLYALGIKIGGDDSPSPEIPINAGDVVTASGLLSLGSPINVTFYRNK